MAADAETRGDVFDRLRSACADEWRGYVTHPFVERLGDGSLEPESFKHYLIQDYLFLLHFSRAYALGVYKSDTVEDMRALAGTLDALLNTELGLHIRTCADWGLREADILAVPEAEQNLAYTRYVLETGAAGDLLDLLVALAPCVIGYREIGARLLAEQAGSALAKNPYREWIAMYGGDDYGAVAEAARAQLDRVAARRLGGDMPSAPRWPALCRTFATATRLEAGFWDMGLAAGRS